MTDLDETEHLLRSPRNAECLLESIAEIAAGRVVEHDLLPDDDAVMRVAPTV
jgi:PHD/YefM family antitoxin component YafN of YafNO toxin-antitoxin module